MTIIQIVVGLLLSICVLLQAKGTGLWKNLGPSSYHARRGVEQLLFRLTIILAIVFVIACIASQFIA